MFLFLYFILQIPFGFKKKAYNSVHYTGIT